eukprot:gene17366-23987_t
METIPEPIRVKLVEGGYDSFNKLPNNENVDRWNRVQNGCGLTNSEIDELMNIRFPVQQEDDIPEVLVKDEDESNHASTMFNEHTNDITLWTSNSTLIGGMADFVITYSNVTKARYLNDILCVIEVQSKENEELCIMQMLVYLLILMNTKHLQKLVGFLVLNNGLCRAFKATRNENGDYLYEQNGLFHVSYIVQMM